MNIKWFSTSAVDYSDVDNLNGGNFYDKLSFKILSKYFEFELLHHKRPKEKSLLKNVIRTVGFYNKIRKTKIDSGLVILDSISLSMFNFTRNVRTVAVVHQLHYNLQKDWKQYYITKKFYKNLRKVDIIVVVSEYWKKEMLKLGCRDVRIIYNPYDISKFTFTVNQISDFRKRYNIPENLPLIYLGNCRKEKGAAESFENLKNINAFFVTSGFKNIDLPVPNLNLPYSDYLLLLKASKVVLTMSKLTEGWCRTAHEAMLCGTPVIGSGTGGMRELLEGGKQIICGDFSELYSHVEKIINDKSYSDTLCKNGIEYASGFTIRNFEDDWIKLINSLN